MAFKIVKQEPKPPKDLRLSLPAEIWEAIETMAEAESVEPAEVIRQALAHVLKPKKAKKGVKVAKVIARIPGMSQEILEAEILKRIKDEPWHSEIVTVEYGTVDGARTGYGNNIFQMCRAKMKDGTYRNVFGACMDMDANETLIVDPSTLE